ncbi:hypothetical protein [Paenibacillus cremeus]|uniref:Tyr recombinase domain-containing protein n=1 Tax=Paenibacillus cremeus TaxID=2163881 RepID=A0A559K8J6_9BACL|nr:hypothetical protein [Paenibacillus cremeus]TVY08451.1 hypothetical protein FPZ49_18625 [Paenibacillus cremeus]
MKNMLFEKFTFVESQCTNPQDAVIIRLIMEGLEIQDLVHLKKDSLDADNRMLTIADGYGSHRKYSISKRCAELFQKAVNQTNYNIHHGYQPNRPTSVNLRNSNHLIKVSNQDFIANESMITDMDSVLLRTIYSRLRKLAEFFSIPELAYLSTMKVREQEPALA